MVINPEYLTREEQYVANVATFAMSELFDVSPENFAVVEGVPGIARCEPTLIYAARRGIDLGSKSIVDDYSRSWDGIVGTEKRSVPGDRFTILVDDEMIDTRKDLAISVYRALAIQDPLNAKPDAPDLSVRRYPMFPMTWLTGMAAKGQRAPFATMRWGDLPPHPDRMPRFLGYQTFGFRPAVKLRR